MLKLPVYLDYNATTPVDASVLDVMLPYFTEHFGNAASRNHSYGWVAQAAVEQAREQVAALINAEPNEIIFTSGATEANNLALKGVFEAYVNKGNHIITAATEHKSILDTCRYLEKKGIDVTYLPVSAVGLVNLQDLESAITGNTVLIAIMYGNNETGVIQPIKEIASVAKQHGVLFFTDATQAVGKLAVDVEREGIHLLSLSAHKIYGPKGIGALYVRRKQPRVKPAGQMHGGGHERGFRSGTLNVPAIVGFGKACEICMQYLPEETKRLKHLTEKLESALLNIEYSFVNGAGERLPNTLNIGFRHVEAERLMMELKKDVAISSASACSSASLEPSYVLKAMGLNDELAYNSMRFSLGRYTTEQEVDLTITKVRAAVDKLRFESPVWQMLNHSQDGRNINK